MFFKRLASYIYPIVLERFNSAVSGTLELGLQNGTLVLDTEIANYSYGNLHLVFRKVVESFHFDKRKRNALILGFGAGSIAHILNKEKQLQLNIDGVELDEMVIDIYHEYFSWQDDQIKIHQSDAFKYLENCTKQYDYIFVDVFENLSVPKQFLSSSFIKLLRKVSHSETQIAMNIIGSNAVTLEKKWLKLLGEKIHIKKYFDLNTVIFHIPEN